MPKNYPLHLVPTKNLPLIAENELDQSHCLGKYVEADKPFRNIDGKLDFAAIEIKRIPGCSSNKIPGSEPSDLLFKFKSEFSDLYKPMWVPGEDGLIPDNDHFEIKHDRNIFFIKISDIHNLTDTYTHPTDKTKPIYNFTVKVQHKPLIANYWHFELITQSDEHLEIKTSTPKWREKICTMILDQIQEKAFFKI